MKTLNITESQMTFVLKEFLKQYRGQFDHASFDEAPGGYIVHFHQSQEPPPMLGEAEEKEKLRQMPEDYPPPSYEPPISIPMPSFGGFGGGSSGGGGATGSW